MRCRPWWSRIFSHAYAAGCCGMWPKLLAFNAVKRNEEKTFLPSTDKTCQVGHDSRGRYHPISGQTIEANVVTVMWGAGSRCQIIPLCWSHSLHRRTRRVRNSLSHLQKSPRSAPVLCARPVIRATESDQARWHFVKVIYLVREEA